MFAIRLSMSSQSSENVCCERLDLERRAPITAGHATQLAIKSDAKHADGMVRFPDGKGAMPWQADPPVIALYGTHRKPARPFHAENADQNQYRKRGPSHKPVKAAASTVVRG